MKPYLEEKISFKRRIKRFVLGLFPESVHLAMARRRARGHEALLEIPKITAFLVERFGRIVLAGPFKGMRYVEASHCSTYVPKLLGSYEEELHGILERYQAHDYELVVDIGSAEGYYAVGMAMISKASVIAYELDPVAQKLCRKMAEINHVGDRIVVNGKCSIDSLQKIRPPAKTLVICDCEGLEYLFLSPVNVPWLKMADIMVELHRATEWGNEEDLVSRFESTHQIQKIATSDRNPKNYFALNGLTEEQKQNAVGEFRGYPQQWAVMTAKNNSVLK